MLFDLFHSPLRLLFLLPYLLVFAAIYIAPLLIATYRNHNNRLQIALLDILLGWTVIGWAVALIWAVGVPVRVIATE